ncbi:MAG TPA: nuclear transport factor 2 family protein [Flavitalea sp.]|nr:nuclear transport factor 2 family protein [Flavitalea sp.]
MRIVFAILLFFSASGAYAQADSTIVKETLVRLENAMIAKQYQEMEALLHRDASFGHSTGWVQSRQEIIDDCKSGRLAYRTIERDNFYVAGMGKDWATVRYTAIMEGVDSGKEFKVALHVLQVWVKTKKGKWQLAARQAAKLPEQPK